MPPETNMGALKVDAVNLRATVEKNDKTIRATVDKNDTINRQEHQEFRKGLTRPGWLALGIITTLASALTGMVVAQF